MPPLHIVLPLLCITTINALLCYNGTFSYKDFGDDPVTRSGWFGPSRRSMARMRCALTIPCPVWLRAQMSWILHWFTLICCVNCTLGLFCYNCSSTQTLQQHCAGDFAPPYRPFNSTKGFLVNCTEENAMCFVRTWRARAKHAWIVQRGCYHADKEDPLPRSMKNPTRAMTCKSQKFIEAEYKVCLCQADWCNSACMNFIPYPQFFINSALGVLAYVLISYR